jgi:hypothetical protein
LSGLLLVALLVAPAVAFVAGFLAGQIRHLALRPTAGAAVTFLPSASLLVLGFGPWATDGDRFAAAFLLVVLGWHIGLWTLFAALGVLVGAAKASGPG